MKVGVAVMSVEIATHTLGKMMKFTSHGLL